MYLACPTNSLKGPELSTLVFGVSRPGMAHFNLNILNYCMYRINGVHRMRRLMCIFVISILKATANRSPYIFTLVQKVKRKVYKIHVFFYAKQNFAENLQVISFKNDVYLLHGRS